MNTASSYLAAPATKLLATACACCGRALVDAVSVETGIGPDCREKFGVDVVADEAARTEANVLVHSVAKKGVSRKECREICQKLAALGFVVLAARIMKRFRMSLPTAADLAAQTETLRAEYASIRASHTYDNVNAREFDQLCKAAGATDAESFVAAAKDMSCTCKRCKGTGAYIGGNAEERDQDAPSPCFRCGGKGRQTAADVSRNRYYDANRPQRYSRAS